MIQAQAQLLASQERYDDALKYYDRVSRYRPDDENVMLGKAELLLRMDRLDDAIEVYREAVDRWPDSAMSLNALGYTLADRTTRYKEAAKLIDKALEIDPTSAAIIDSRGWVLYRLGRYQEALLELERAYERFEDPEVAAHIVEVLWALDRGDEAAGRLADAEERWPEDERLARVRELIESGAAQDD
jgi:tetratricopeptide (TPR) repeat protein